MNKKCELIQKMSIVNTRTKFIRPKYNDLRDWINDSNNVYIGSKHSVYVTIPNTNKKERFPYHSSVFANPYSKCNNLPESEIMKLYEVHIRLKLLMYPDLVNDLMSMKDKNMGCCDPRHGGILLKLINENQYQESTPRISWL